MSRHAAELGAAQVAMKDAQRAALAAATTARRVALAATEDCEKRAVRDREAEGERTKSAALEATLRASHSEAIAALEVEKAELMADVGGLNFRCERLEAELNRLRSIGEASEGKR